MQEQLSQLLVEIVQALKSQELWGELEPSPAALASQQPFALDTLSPEAWLQWVFIPKMQQGIVQQQVPRGFAIAPYFEQVWQSDPEMDTVIALLRAVDGECA